MTMPHSTNSRAPMGDTEKETPVKGTPHKGGITKCTKCQCIHWKDDGVCPVCGEDSCGGGEDEQRKRD